MSCNQDCPCSCPEGEVNCIDDPCQNAECPAYPDATCYSNFCGGCNAIFTFKGEIVNCDVSLPACIPRGERCNAYIDRINDVVFDDLECCNNLQCCPDRCFDEDFDDDDGNPDNDNDMDDDFDDDGVPDANDDDLDDDGEISITVTSVFGTCRNSCACRRRR